MNNVNNQLVMPASVMNTEKGTQRSSRYSLVPTTNVLSVLQDNGWAPVKAVAVRARKEAPLAKHIVELEHPTYSPIDDGDKLRIHLLNSHNGQSAFELRLGIFRLVCSNGLVVSKGTVEGYNIRHVGYAPEKVHEALVSIVAALPKATETIKLFKSVELTPGQLDGFAVKAAQIKFNTEGFSFPIVYNELLRVRRLADDQPNLWAAYNRVQENIMQGGMSIIEPGKNNRTRSTRKISNINEQSRINKGLWDLALSYAKEVA